MLFGGVIFAVHGSPCWKPSFLSQNPSRVAMVVYWPGMAVCRNRQKAVDHVYAEPCFFFLSEETPLFITWAFQ
jgi:hypothetical protein